MDKETNKNTQKKEGELLIMVNRPDSSSTRSDKSSSSTRSSMNRNNLNKTALRSKSGNDDKTQNKLRNSGSLQSMNNKSSGNQSLRGMRKFKSNGRFVCVFVVGFMSRSFRLTMVLKNLKPVLNWETHEKFIQNVSSLCD